VKRLVALLLAVVPASCTNHRPQAAVAQAHYVLGDPYVADGVWQYPHEQYDATMTGLASVYGDSHPALTTNGEAFDQRALAAGHRTLQLPAIARLTDLETGRQVMMRINDRGPAAPGRLLEVTRRTAELLGFPPDQVARVRLEVLPADSHAAADALPGAPRLSIASAPRVAVAAVALAAPGGARAALWHEPILPSALPADPAPAFPATLTERLTQIAPRPGALWVELGSFTERRFARVERNRLAVLRPAVASIGRREATMFVVRTGPYGDVARADAALDRAILAGVTDARIVVE
jgi:rare lipoprotein A